MAQEQKEAQQQVTSEVDTDKLLVEGKKCLAASDPAGAVNHLQEACSALAAVHGQLSKELAEPYYLYGKALLELARAESTVLGSGIPVPEERESSDDEEDVPGDQADNGDVPGDQSDNGDADKTACVKAQEGGEVVPAGCEGTSDIAATNEGGNGSTPTNNETAAMTSKDGAQTEEESDLQIAWEVLELARVICQREDSNECKLKLADINMVLAEVGMESDQYDQAISDLLTSLQLREFVLEPQDRRLAEVHFSLGLAYTLANQVDNAIKSYKKSREILVQRKEQLEEQAKNVGSDQKIEDEINELASLLPDIDSKVTDAEVLKRVMEERSKEMEEGGETSHGFGTSKSASGKVEAAKDVPVTDITHLVRKRPASSEDNSTKQTKRQCTEETREATSNGDSTVTAEQ